MMFSGQGTQYANMGLELYRSEKVFRQEVDRCAELLQPHLGFDLREALYPREDQITQADEKLKQTFVTQPALFAIEYALARWFQSLGVVADAMIGHSIGEYVAACLSGVFSLEDALRLVAARGRLMQELPGGAMLAVQVAEKELQPWLNGKISLAASNGPSLCVISGSHEAIDATQTELTERNIGCRRLHTSHAFHSSMMEPILQPFIQQLETVSLKAPQIPYISNVTGTWITEAEATSPEYWARHLRQPVLFSAGAAELVKDQRNIMLEIGPGQTLCTLLRQQPDRPAAQISVPSLRPPQERQSDTAFALTALGKLWLAGVEVDWRAFHRGDQRRRVPLPTYPFERQRYWIEPARNADAGRARPSAAGKRADIADWFYTPLWKQTAPLAQSPPAQTKRWLLVGDRGGLMAQVAQRLKELSQDVVVVEHGADHVKLDADAYSVDPRNADDYYGLLRELETRGCLPQVALHFGALAPLEPAESRQELFFRAQEKSFYSLLNLTKAIGRIYISDALQIGVISSGLHDVTGQEETIPEKTTVLGLCKVIPQEYPNIGCRSIDLPLEGDRAAFKPETSDQLIAEMSAESADLIIAYRNHRRWIQSFDPVRLDEPGPQTRGLREGGVYLITGGLGGVGLVLAEHFARAARARLVLIGRSEFPSRDDWPKWLAEHDTQDPISVKIRRLQMFEEMGGAVTVLSANVADKGRMQEVIAEVYDRFGALHGVVHGAGINGSRSVRAILETGQTECEWHFEPKALGLQILSEVLQDRELDFCLLLSSLSATLGGLGFTAYSAANIYMDALVQQQSKTSAIPWITVNWDGWLLSEEGMTNNVGAALDALAMKPAEGAAAFDRILASPVLTQVVVSTGDLRQRMEQWLRPGASGPALRSDPESAGAFYPRPELATDYVAPATTLEQTVADTWRELLGIEQIGVHDNFFELGGHSLLATQLVSRIRKLFNVELPLRRFFEAPTISDIAELVLQSQAEQLGAEKLAELSEDIQALSEEELKELLESEKQTLSKDASR
jgi:acyl transferase domain-containing protein/acyl carrier protein